VTQRPAGSTPNGGRSTADRRRPRVTREEGMARLVKATIALATERPVGELSAREIARRAELNHANVHVWFGSKAGLLDAACQRLGDDLRVAFTAERLTSTALQDPRVELLFQLLARLQNEPGGIELAGVRRRPVVEFVEHQLRANFGISREEAADLAELAVMGAAGAVLVGRVLGVDLDRLTATWWSFAGRQSRPL